ncbi:putative 2-oxo-4-hydroxy-4-carboxy-5-ureidoimidazoline decarboxylase isoform 1-T1 [Rhynchonycteris naso]
MPHGCYPRGPAQSFSFGKERSPFLDLAGSPQALCPALFYIKAPLRAENFEKIRNAWDPYRVPAPSQASRKFRVSEASPPPFFWPQGLKGQICHFPPRPWVRVEAESSWHRRAQGQEGILRCHPDLAGHELQRGTLTAESQREQSDAGLIHLGSGERSRLAELNARYRARFGFPFVLAARLSDRDAVPRELARRLRCPPALELRTALGEVKKIGRLRLSDLLGVDPAPL